MAHIKTYKEIQEEIKIYKKELKKDKKSSKILQNKIRKNSLKIKSLKNYFIDEFKRLCNEIFKKYNSISDDENYDYDQVIIPLPRKYKFKNHNDFDTLEIVKEEDAKEKNFKYIELYLLRNGDRGLYITIDDLNWDENLQEIFEFIKSGDYKHYLEGNKLGLL